MPLVHGTKRPMVPDWQNRSPRQLERWLAQAKKEGPVNIGCRLDGLVVVDCDSEHAVTRWEAEAPPTVFQSRGRPERRAFWYSLPHGAHVRAGKMWGGEVDVKTGPGHQVVLPPSLHPEGHTYAWLGPSPEEWDVLELPAAPVEFLTTERLTSWCPEGAEEIDYVGEGNRDNALTTMAGLLRRHGLSEGAMRVALSALNASVCRPPKSEGDVARIARSVASYAPGPSDGGGEVPTQSSGIVLMDDDEE